MKILKMEKFKDVSFSCVDIKCHVKKTGEGLDKK